MLPCREKHIMCLGSLAHNRSGVFGAKRPYLASTSCVKVFESTFKAMSFHGLHCGCKRWGKASLGAKVVQLVGAFNT